MRTYLRVSFLVLFALPALSIAAPAFAQTPTPRFEDQTVVTPSRTESTLADVPVFATLLDADDIAGSAAADIPDLLRQSGVQVTDITGSRRSYRVDLRGFGATAGLNTLVLVDGRRVNQPDLSGADWAQIPLERVARIEVIRGGGGAVVYGDNATGGVINIITKDGGKKETHLALGAGSYGSVMPTVSTRGTSGKMSYAVSGGFGRSDGHRDNAQTKGGDLGGRLVATVNERFEVGVSAGYHGDRTGLPGSLKEDDFKAGVKRSETVTPDDFANVDDSYVMVTPRVTFGKQGYASVDVSFRQRDSTFFSTFVGGNFTGNTGTGTTTVSPKVVWSNAFGKAMNQLVAGADVSSATEDITNTTVFGGFPDVGLFTLEKGDKGVYVRDEVRAARLTLTGGYRYDSARNTFKPSTPSTRNLDAQAADIGATVKVNANASLFAGFSRSFRYPVLDEMFDFFSNTIVTTLEPQKSNDLEAGLRAQTGNTRASVTLFHSSTDDEIFFNPIGGSFGFGANENLDGTALRNGVEIALSTIVQRVEVGGTVSVLKAKIDGGTYDGQEMPSVAPHRATILARIPLMNRWSLGLDGTFTGARQFEGDFTDAFGKQDSFFVLDAKVAYAQGRSRLFVDLKNLFNKEYDEYGVIGGFPTQRAVYPSPGFHVMVGAEVTF